MADTRREKDPLGPLDVPSDALYGVQTLRAVQNFPLSGLRPLEAFVIAQVWIKKAAALTHKETGRLDPKMALAYYARGRAYFGLKDRKRAIQDYDEALRLNPKYALAYIDLGILLNMQNRLVEGEAFLRQAVALDQHTPR